LQRRALRRDASAEQPRKGIVDRISAALYYRELRRVIKEAANAKDVCSTNVVGRGYAGKVFVVEIPADPQSSCSNASKTFKIAIKRSKVRMKTEREDARNEREVLRKLHGEGGDYIGYFGSKRTMSAQFLFLQAADRSLRDFLMDNSVPQRAELASLQPGASVVTMIPCNEGYMGVVKKIDHEKGTATVVVNPEGGANSLPASCLGTLRHFEVRVGLVIQLLRSLAGLEARGMQHHDIKPENCLITGSCQDVSDCHLMLADFGFTCTSTVKGLRSCGMQGTPDFASPEFAKAVRAGEHEAFFPRGDVWAAGVTAFELLVGRFPMPDFERRDELWAELATRADPTADLLPGEVVAWRPLLQGMLQRSPRRRLSAVQALGLAIEIARRENIPEPPEHQAPQLPRDLFSDPRIL